MEKVFLKETRLKRFKFRFIEKYFDVSFNSKDSQNSPDFCEISFYKSKRKIKNGMNEKKTGQKLVVLALVVLECWQWKIWKNSLFWID